MSALTFEIWSTDNAAFADNRETECARLLRAAADRIEQGRDSAYCVDYNGNKVGYWEFTDDDE
jgi:hypothetical protein